MKNKIVLKQFFHQTEHLVRHITERQVEQGGCCHHRTLVRERLETELAMIVSHTGIAYATEWDVLVGNVHDGVIDT